MQEWPIENIVGVVDLLDGKAVHAIAGDRANYQPVAFCVGDPIALAQHYRRRGVQSLYVADLDAISGRPLQVDLLRRLGALFDGEMIVDPGWRGPESHATLKSICNLLDAGVCSGVIASTESVSSPEELARLTERVSVDKVWLGLDYRAGDLIVSPKLRACSASDHMHSVSDNQHRPLNEVDVWITESQRLGVNRVVVLDLAMVGRGQGPVTGEICRGLKEKNSAMTIWSGGGIRDANDAIGLIRSGCNGCLVATALQHHK